VSKSEDLSKLEHIIKDMENRLKSFNSNVDTIQKEIDFLLNLERQLESNITMLKGIKIVALASEYKKAREDLKKTKNRLTQLKSDRMINERAFKELKAMLEKNKESYEKLHKQSENNVLQGKFGRKRV
jgi:chromosome segregation ATPase